ncbi:4310_t:CDS:2 [Dentiscutata heterogama]|uniref:4310_t:CDS:1 n=1 Tax=Dentiscutata heterogama TaxID=1316150 RepID=A0ACA9KZZ9_9GLOM|nr:4310_t:CDS:2 [Dentiscutata heterogama]
MDWLHSFHNWSKLVNSQDLTTPMKNYLRNDPLEDSRIKDFEYEKSQKDLDKAIELDPSELYFHWQRGSLFYAREEYEKAMEEFTTLNGFKPKLVVDKLEQAEAFYNRGLLYQKLGRIENAILDFEKSFNLDPSNDAAKSIMKKLSENI